MTGDEADAMGDWEMSAQGAEDFEDGPEPERMTCARQVIDPDTFNHWWTHRQPANRDKAMIRAAEAAGLIMRGNGMLSLTEKGNSIRLRPGNRKIS